MLIAMAGIFFALSPIAQPDDATGRPNALVRFYESRARLATAEIDWSRRRYDGSPVEAAHTQYYTSRLSPEERTLRSRGDEEGASGRSDAGPDTNLNFWSEFEGRNVMFQNHDRPGDTRWIPKGTTAPVPDLRSLGAHPQFLHLGDVHDAFWKDPSVNPVARVYSERTEGGLRVVSAETGIGTITWWIDPQRGWQATRVTYSQGDKVVNEARVSLEKSGEYWFPKCVMYFSRAYQDGAEPSDVVTVDRAVFNDSAQPRVLTPADIGIMPGAFTWLEDNSGQKAGTGKWDGSKITEVRLFPVPGAEYVALKLEKSQSPTTTPSAGPPPAASQPVPPESEWEAYTRRFIARYKLTVEQSQSALRVLKGCQEEAQNYLDRHKAEFERLAKEEGTLQQSGAKQTDARLASIKEEREKLRGPINEVFEKQLKPRLEKLPTRAQRAAAERDDKAASQPTPRGN